MLETSCATHLKYFSFFQKLFLLFRLMDGENELQTFGVIKISLLNGQIHHNLEKNSRIRVIFTLVKNQNVLNIKYYKPGIGHLPNKIVN